MTQGPSALVLRTLVASLGVVWASASCSAQLYYDFVESESGSVLATLELASLPASHTEVIGLSFTPAGQALFGLGVTYGGTFDATAEGGEFRDDGALGLVSSIGDVGFVDTDPQETSLPDWAEVSFFHISAGNQSQSATLYQTGAFAWSEARGTWRLVPEPSTGMLLTIAVLFGLGARYRRRVITGDNDH